MSKQIRMACAVLDMLASQPVVTLSDARDRIEYDEGSLRQTFKVLSETGYAQVRGVAVDGRTKLYSAGPKLGGAR